MSNMLEFLRNIQQMVILYATTGMRPNLKDRILRIWFPRQTATTMLSTTSALQLRNLAQQSGYPQDPTVCQHEMGLRQYGAAGHRVNICDQCGARWVLHPTDQELIPIMPKAAPNAKTPLGIPASSGIPAKAKAKAIPGRGPRSVASWVGSAPSRLQQGQPSTMPKQTTRRSSMISPSTTAPKTRPTSRVFHLDQEDRMSVQSARSSQAPGSWMNFEPPENFQEMEENFWGTNPGLDEDTLYGEDSYNPNHDMTNYDELDHSDEGH